MTCKWAALLMLHVLLLLGLKKTQQNLSDNYSDVACNNSFMEKQIISFEDLPQFMIKFANIR